MQVGEGFVEIHDEGAHFANLDDDVIDVGIGISSHLGPQGDTHQPLEGSPRALQAEGHAYVIATNIFIYLRSNVN